MNKKLICWFIINFCILMKIFFVIINNSTLVIGNKVKETVISLTYSD